MPQMYPMSWVLIFLFVDFMLVFVFLLVSMVILEDSWLESNFSDGLLVSSLIWMW